MRPWHGVFGMIWKTSRPWPICKRSRNIQEEPLIDTILEALDRHFAGISFRERNAGHSIDEHMRDSGKWGRDSILTIILYALLIVRNGKCRIVCRIVPHFRALGYVSVRFDKLNFDIASMTLFRRK